MSWGFLESVFEGRIVVHLSSNVASGRLGNVAKGRVGQNDSTKFRKVIGSNLVRPQTTTTGGKPGQGSRVKSFQTKTYFNGKGVSIAVETVPIATFKGDGAVDGGDAFRLLVLVMRFFLQQEHSLASAVVSTRLTRSWSFCSKVS